MLIDLAGSLPAWFPAVSRVLVIAAFTWLLFVRGASIKSWVVRPRVSRTPGHLPLIRNGGREM
jgi:hypothetical protein